MIIILADYLHNRFVDIDDYDNNYYFDEENNHFMIISSLQTICTEENIW